MKNWFRIAWLNFIVLALAGVVLRLFPFVSLSGINFSFLVHAHSHIALLGWLYNGILLLVVHYYFRPYFGELKGMLIAYQLNIMLMFIAFTIQGYGFYAILFSSIQIILSYGIVIKLISIKKQNKLVVPHAINIATLFFLGTSFLPFLVAVFKVLGLFAEHQKSLVNVYLYLQTSGFMLFAILGLVLTALKVKDKVFVKSLNYIALTVFVLLILDLGITDLLLVKAFIFIVSLIQLFWILKLRKIVTTNLIFKLLLFTLVLKSIVQLMVLHPDFQLWMHNRSFVLAYLHALLLVMFSIALWQLFIESKFLAKNNFKYVVFSLGAVGTVLVLSMQGFSLLSSSILELLILGVLMFVALLLSVSDIK